MVDWDQVERLRTKGWDWERIAADPRVEFTAETAGGDAGRQLRALYYQRRSKAQRKGSDPTKPGATGKLSDGRERAPLLLQIGYILAPALGLWTLLTYVLPWPALIVPLLDVLFIFIISLFVLLFALFRAEKKWMAALRGPLVIGIVVGLVIPGGLTLYAIQEGCPTLKNSAAAGEANGWDRYDNGEWTQNGAPVFFFYGSIACPFCSASSWAMAYALMSFGTLTGTSLRISNPTDSPASVPEIDLSGAALQSQYVSLAVYEGTNNLSILPLPSLPGCQYSAYYSLYDTTQSIPFVVIGGQYVHTGVSIVAPPLNGPNGVTESPQTCQAQMNAQSGECWSAANGPMYSIDAILCKLNGSPSALPICSNPNVKTDVHDLS